MNTRVLLFPIAVATVTTLDACAGIDINSPMVRACHDDTTEVLYVFPNGAVAHDTMVVHDNPATCRKAA